MSSSNDPDGAAHACMYANRKFRTANNRHALQLIAEYPFAHLITMAGGTIIRSSHLPIVLPEGLDREAALADWTKLELLGHLATANPQAAELDGAPILLVFTGPNAYVTPTWYQMQPAAPTWNYADVQVRGVARMLDQEEALAVIERTIQVLEDGRDPRWLLEGESVDYANRILPGVRAFRVEVTGVDYQFKLSQDKPSDVQQRVREGLAASRRGQDRDVAELMEALGDELIAP